MSRHAAVIAVVLGTLAAPAAAQAKEVSEVSVCGRAGACTTYDRSSFDSLMFLAQDAGPTDPPASAARWYRVRFTVDEREHGGGFARWTVAYVPSADSLRVRDESGRFAWVALNPRAASVLRRAVRELPAFPAARLRGLDVEPPAARVDAVYPPSAETAAPSGRTPWGWIAGGALAAALALTTVARSLRRPASARPGTAGSSPAATRRGQ
jgi:hypothetical protein